MSVPDEGIQSLPYTYVYNPPMDIYHCIAPDVTEKLRSSGLPSTKRDKRL